MKVTISNARPFVVLALVLTFVADGAMVGQQPQPSHSPALPQSPAKISSGDHIQPLRPGLRFPYGESLNYEGEWRFFTAGVATISLKIVAQGNRKAISRSNRMKMIAIR